MTKEEILDRARRENKGADIVDLEIQSKSRGLAGAISMTVGAALNLLCDMLFDHSFPLFWVMFFSYLAAWGFSNSILGLRNGRREKLVIWLLYGLLMLVMTVLAVIRLFAQMKAGAV